MLQLVFIALISAGLLWASLLYLDYFTHHGEEITVPELIGIHKSELTLTLDSTTLEFIILDSAYVSDKDKGIVLDQNPGSAPITIYTVSGSQSSARRCVVRVWLSSPMQEKVNVVCAIGSDVSF